MTGRPRQRGRTGFLPALRPRSHGALGAAALAREREGAAGGGDAREALSLPRPPPPGRGAPDSSDDCGEPARDALLQEDGIPGLPHPSASLSTSSRRPRPLRPRRGRRGAARGRWLPARGCALTGTRAAPSGSSAFRPPHAPRPLRGPARRRGRVTPPFLHGPTWRRGPGRTPEAAQAEGACGEEVLLRPRRPCPPPSVGPGDRGAPVPPSASVSPLRLSPRSPGLPDFVFGCVVKGGGDWGEGSGLAACLSESCFRTLCSRSKLSPGAGAAGRFSHAPRQPGRRPKTFASGLLPRPGSCPCPRSFLLTVGRTSLAGRGTEAELCWQLSQ